MLGNQKVGKQPEIWHHGLVARSWAELSTDGGQEAVFFKNLIETTGQPALDLGCGTGRLLLPLRKAGLDVDGCDVSKDMLDYCQESLEKNRLSAGLYAQAIHELDLPRRYRTIFACGVIGLGGERRLTMLGMRRCYEHLRPGGIFAFDFNPRYNDPPAYLSRLAENRHTLPEEWPVSTERDSLSDGTELELTARTVSVDPLTETQTRQMRARLWRNGVLVDEQIHTQRYEEYGVNELQLMLEQAGFGETQIYGDYKNEPATSDHGTLIFIAKK
jgi:SAM-dependent methyltransferase